MFGLQAELFGYERGGDGVKSGRRILRKRAYAPHFASWYPPDFFGRLRSRERRSVRDLESLAKRVLPPGEALPPKFPDHQIRALKQNGLSLMSLKPPLSLTMRASDRAAAEARFGLRVLRSVSREALEDTTIRKTQSETRRAEQLVRLKKRGRGAPQKGHGKRASGAKAKRR